MLEKEKYFGTLSHQNLSGESFMNIDVSGRSFAKSKLANAVFIGCDLRGCDFYGADLWKTNFEGADLRDSFFNEANLKDTKFAGAKLKGTDFRHAYLIEIDLHGADWSGAKLYDARVTTEQAEFLKKQGVKDDLWVIAKCSNCNDYCGYLNCKREPYKKNKEKV